MSSPTHPIRVALIGLPGTAPERQQGTAWTANAHLPYLLNSDHYQIVALCNTSVQRAKEAVKLHGLPETTKTYGNPEDVAADPDIDLVVSSVRVERHFPTAAPSLRAGKAVFVEWPIGSNLAEAEELAELAKQHHAKNLVGLQGKFSPVVQKLRELIRSERIGKVLSSSYLATVGTDVPTAKDDVSYFVERAVGTNPLTTTFGHSSEYIQYVLGEFASFDSLLLNGQPLVDIVDRDGKLLDWDDAHNQDDPAQIVVQAKTERGSVVTFFLRRGKPQPGKHIMEWRIFGQDGELRVTSPTPFLNVGHPDTKIELHDHKTGKIETVDCGEDELAHLPLAARNIGRMYEAFWKGEEGVRDFDLAVKRHRMIEEMWRRYDAHL